MPGYLSEEQQTVNHDANDIDLHSMTSTVAAAASSSSSFTLSSHSRDSTSVSPTQSFASIEQPSPGVEDVRKRIDKRKRRKPNEAPNISTSDSTPPDDDKEMDDRAAKRRKNTMAARKYRQQRKEEVEVLDKRVKDLEEQLQMAKVEAKWWQMEAERWKKLAESG